MTFSEPTTAEEVRALAAAVARRRNAALRMPARVRQPMPAPKPIAPSVPEPVAHRWPIQRASKLSAGAIATIEKSLAREKKWSCKGQNILRAVSIATGYSVEDLTGPRRWKEYRRGQFVAAYLMVKHTGLALQQIGKILKRDHTTVIHRASVVNDDLRSYASLIEAVKGLAPELFPADALARANAEGA